MSLAVRVSRASGRHRRPWHSSPFPGQGRRQGDRRAPYRL